MILPQDLENQIRGAVSFFWQTREGQMNRQTANGAHDQGNRGAVTGGRQLDGFIQLMRDILVLNNVPPDCIFTDRDVELPGYYRPNKKWDLLVVDDGTLIIAIEFKSQVGPSFGNNFNNRTEEAIGSAVDIWTAYREGVFGAQNAPWLGYFFVLEDCPQSNSPVRIRSPHFPVRIEYDGSSYKERYELFCNKLLLERQYSAACFITTNHTDHMISYEYPNNNLSLDMFITSMVSAVTPHFMIREQ